MSIIKPKGIEDHITGWTKSDTAKNGYIYHTRLNGDVESEFSLEETQGDWVYLNPDENGILKITAVANPKSRPQIHDMTRLGLGKVLIHPDGTAERAPTDTGPTQSKP